MTSLRNKHVPWMLIFGERMSSQTVILLVLINFTPIYIASTIVQDVEEFYGSCFYCNGSLPSDCYQTEYCGEEDGNRCHTYREGDLLWKGCGCPGQGNTDTCCTGDNCNENMPEIAKRSVFNTDDSDSDSSDSDSSDSDSSDSDSSDSDSSDSDSDDKDSGDKDSNDVDKLELHKDDKDKDDKDKDDKDKDDKDKDDKDKNDKDKNDKDKESGSHKEGSFSVDAPEDLCIRQGWVHQCRSSLSAPAISSYSPSSKHVEKSGDSLKPYGDKRQVGEYSGQPGLRKDRDKTQGRDIDEVPEFSSAHSHGVASTHYLDLTGVGVIFSRNQNENAVDSNYAAIGFMSRKLLSYPEETSEYSRSEYKASEDSAGYNEPSREEAYLVNVTVRSQENLSPEVNLNQNGPIVDLNVQQREMPKKVKEKKSDKTNDDVGQIQTENNQTIISIVLKRNMHGDAPNAIEMNSRQSAIEIDHGQNANEMGGQQSADETEGHQTAVEMVGQQHAAAIEGQQSAVEMEGHQNTIEMDGHRSSVETEGHQSSVETEGQPNTVEMDGLQHAVEMEGHQSSVETEGHPNTVEMDGHQSAIEMEGHQNPVEIEGHRSAAKMEGHQSAVEIEGNQNAVAMEGHQSAVAIEGDQSATKMEGHQSAVDVEGNQGAVEMEGHQSLAEMEGYQSQTEMGGHQHAVEMEGHQHAPSIEGHQSAVETEGHQHAPSIEGHQSALEIEGHQRAASIEGHQSAIETEGHQHAASIEGHQSAVDMESHQRASSIEGHQHAASIEGHQSAFVVEGHQSAINTGGTDIEGYQSAVAMESHQSAARMEGHQSSVEMEGHQSSTKVDGYQSAVGIDGHQSGHELRGRHQSVTEVDRSQSAVGIVGHQSVLHLKTERNRTEENNYLAGSFAQESATPGPSDSIDESDDLSSEKEELPNVLQVHVHLDTEKSKNKIFAVQHQGIALEQGSYCIRCSRTTDSECRKKRHCSKKYADACYTYRKGQYIWKGCGCPRTNTKGLECCSGSYCNAFLDASAQPLQNYATKAISCYACRRRPNNMCDVMHKCKPQTQECYGYKKQNYFWHGCGCLRASGAFCCSGHLCNRQIEVSYRGKVSKQRTHWTPTKKLRPVTNRTHIHGGARKSNHSKPLHKGLKINTHKDSVPIVLVLFLGVLLALFLSALVLTVTKGKKT